MSGKNSIHDIAERYATAYLAAAKAGKGIDAAASDLETLTALLAESEDFRTLGDKPGVTRAAAARAASAIGQKLGLADVSVSLLGVLAENRRLSALPQIIARAQARIAAEKGQVTADVTAAHDLSDAQQKKLAESLKAALGAEVKLNVATDPALIGGIVVKVGSVMIDHSVASKLNRLHRELKKGAAADTQTNTTKREVA